RAARPCRSIRRAARSAEGDRARMRRRAARVQRPSSWRARSSRVDATKAHVARRLLELSKPTLRRTREGERIGPPAAAGDDDGARRFDAERVENARTPVAWVVIRETRPERELFDVAAEPTDAERVHVARELFARDSDRKRPRALVALGRRAGRDGLPAL